MTVGREQLVLDQADRTGVLGAAAYAASLMQARTRQDLLDRICRHGTLQRHNRRSGHLAERGLDDSSLLRRRCRLSDDLRYTLIE
ncbi:hypothetical protein EDD93_7079 [Streptomyces sp. 840.1]|uniref:hypothetical protein n=1 Tax=Streptomyces sp. 840.1 TaxID=2485152 RepID=UPI000F4831A6|nr:hypothetical protein [Streptomyces sp. 840.1]ROQ59678.1 hypothetical protein EDD93_7079 [Streptomyces sp. 840.1]